MTSIEIVQALKRSSLPTVITEGQDDYMIFRKLEEKLSKEGSHEISLLPAGGKNVVLDVFRHRHDFSHVQTAFVVDKDLWLFSGVPAEYSNNQLILTEGYSIENDLYRDANLLRILDQLEQERFAEDCKSICQWFSFAVKSQLDGIQKRLDFHPNNLLCGPGQLTPDIMSGCGYTEPDDHLFTLIFSDYTKYLRGKTLIDLLVCHASYPGRAARHNRKALLEIASSRFGVHMNNIFLRLIDIFR